MVKSTIDIEFREKKIGPKLISAIFPISSPRSSPEEPKDQDETGNKFVARIKSSATEILFLYIMQAATLFVAMVTFTVISSVSKDFRLTLEKVEKTRLSIGLAINCLCPLALLESLLLTLLYHYTFSAWKVVSPNKTFSGPECPLLPRNKVSISSTSSSSSSSSYSSSSSSSSSFAFSPFSLSSSSKVTTKWMTVPEGPKADELTADFVEILEVAKDRRQLATKQRNAL